MAIGRWWPFSQLSSPTAWRASKLPQAEALAHGVHSADVVLNILARKRDPGPVVTILTPEALRLRHAPVADCARYDRLRRVS